MSGHGYNLRSRSRRVAEDEVTPSVLQDIPKRYNHNQTSQSQSLTVTQDEVTPSPAVFQNILKERIAERRNIAKEKCEVGRRSIEGMWSKTGVDPAEVFPPEMWKIILNHLGPDEKMSMFNIHNMFEKLLERTKIRDILLPKLITSGVMDFHTIRVLPNERSLRRGCPYNTVAPPVKFTTLRSVSKSVRDAVDTYYENTLLKFLRYEIIPDFIPKMNINLNLGGDTPSETNEILKYFGERAASPDASEKLDFRIRSLKIIVTSGEEALANANLAVVQRIMNEVTCFLKQVGHNFWRFQISCGDFQDLTNGSVLAELYKTFYMWLELIPQLKWLDITFKTESETLLPPVRRQEMVVGRFAAPKLESLERVDLDLLTSRADVMGFCKAILERNSHIKIFRLRCTAKLEEIVDPVFAKFVPLISQLLPNLDCLDLSYETIDLDNLQKCVNFGWQLKKLILRVESKYKCINEIFQFLEKFPTLEEVTLTLYSLIVSATNGNIKFLKLPNLKVFHLHLYESIRDSPNKLLCTERNFQIFLNLHFLLYCSNLRTIKWTSTLRFPTIRKVFAEYLENSPEGMIDFRDGRKDLSDSNIWNVFPRLEEVSVRQRDDLRYQSFEKIYRNRQLVKYWAGKYVSHILYS